MIRTIHSERGVLRTASRVSLLLVALVLLLVIARLMMPWYVLRYVNKVLNRLPEYQGHVDDIDIALIRGAYVIDKLRLNKRNGKLLQPFVAIERTDLSIEWRALFQGKLVGEIEFEHPELNLVNSDDKSEEQLSTNGDWQSMIKDLFPVELNRTAVTDGEVTYRHEGTKDEKSLVMTDIDGEITGLSNRPQKGELLPAQVHFTGEVQDLAPISVKAKIDPFAKKPTFDGDLTTEALPLERINKLLRRTLEIDAESGTIQLFAEATSHEGKYRGYVKPILRDIRFVSIENDSSNPLRLLWEGIVNLVTEVFTNRRHNQFASKIPFEGTLDAPEIGIFSALGTIVRNAYVQALKTSIDDDISLKEQKKEE